MCCTQAKFWIVLLRYKFNRNHWFLISSIFWMAKQRSFASTKHLHNSLKPYFLCLHICLWVGFMLILHIMMWILGKH